MVYEISRLAHEELVSPDIRVGQAHMNSLKEVFPSVHAKIVGTEADPFYDDDRMDAFWEKVFASLVRITGNEIENEFFLQLGITPDADSRPDLFEWYWRMPLEDAEAAAALFTKSYSTMNTVFRLRYSLGAEPSRLSMLAQQWQGTFTLPKADPDDPLMDHLLGKYWSHRA